jgi:hypothetical protein
MNNVLASAPKYFRAPISRGGQPRVERDGGYRNAGLIRGVSVITKGEALGHGLWIDETTLEQVADAINANKLGVKSRFSHPSASGDALGKNLGRVMEAEVEGDQVIADQHFNASAHKSPDGDLAEYLESLAEDDPTAYGISIAFLHDAEAMEQFAEQHSIDGEFKSPDPLNENNYPHVRIKELHAADSVDSPAANPDGLFHREGDLAKLFDDLTAYAFGLTSERPMNPPYDPDRVRGFAKRFLETHQLELKEKHMSEDTSAESAVVETAEVTPQDQTEPVSTEPEPMSGRDEAAEFVAAFGRDGAVWYAEGLTFEQCRERQLAELRKENEQLKTKLAARPLDGEDSPVSFDAQETKGKGSLSSYLR